MCDLSPLFDRTSLGSVLASQRESKRQIPIKSRSRSGVCLPVENGPRENGPTATIGVSLREAYEIQKSDPSPSNGAGKGAVSHIYASDTRYEVKIIHEDS
jgi:hypothetical protein